MAYQKNIYKHYTIMGMLTLGVLVGIGGSMLTWPLAFYKDSLWSSWVLVIMWCLWSLYVINFIVENYHKSQVLKNRGEKIQALAAKSDYVFSLKTSSNALSKNFKRIELKNMRITCELRSGDWRYCELRYDDYRRTRHGDLKIADIYYSILELDLGRELPNIFFDGKNSHGQQFVWKIDQAQRSSLEGNFDDYFVTYFPEQYHIDARSIISPEVMAAIIDIAPCDIEIYKNKLYIYSGLRPVDSISVFMIAAKKLRRQLIDHATHYVDELSSKGREKEVSVLGIELNKRPIFPWVIIVITIGLFAFYALNPTNLDDKVSLGGYAVVFLFITLFSVYRWYSDWQDVVEKRKRSKLAATKRDKKYR